MQATAYNPAANGKVENFHHTLKAALMSRCKDSNWFTQVPWVLLGLRITNDTLDVSAAEMVYGDPLAVPAEFFPSATYSDNFQHLCPIMGKFTPCRQTYQPPPKQHIPTDLHSATHVFLCNDSTKPRLTSPYTGPFLVIHCMLKACCINIRSKEDGVSIDCLKPAYILLDVPPPNITPL
ncbi:uncharacterized protein [Palaemon carinicauda]|uniref:uncharacterized protein n=1 Tax=Palaemon carinicauda TaxID=392227 RepID=UPI0035B5859D